MANFPLLSSGAVTQYPSGVVRGQGIRVIRFIDGTDQRYLLEGQSLRRWMIRLDLLNESEVQAIEQFFDAVDGDYSTFTFTDPFTGSAVSNCRFGAPELTTEYAGVDASSTSFWVIETNG